MKYKLKNNNGKVNALLHTGKDFVKEVLKVSAAQHIIDSGELVESDKEGYPIHVGEWYFEGEPLVEKVETSTAYGETKNKFDKRGRK